MSVSTLGGAALGALITAIGAWLLSRKQAQNEDRLARVALAQHQVLALTARASDFLAATYHSVLTLRDVALARIVDKELAEKESAWPTVDRVNKNLVAVEINDVKDLYEAARAIDRALVALAKDAMAREYTRDTWRAHRDSVMGELPQAFKDVARAEVDRLQAIV